MVINNCCECKKQCLDYHTILSNHQDDESFIIMDDEIDKLFKKCLDKKHIVHKLLI